MTLLNWALTVYARPEVEQALLDLQDSAEQSVCLLLWAGWAGETGRALDDEAFEEAADVARAWETSAILALRAVRRGLKKPIPDLDAAAREAVRDQVKAVEIEAEKALLAQLGSVGGAGGKALATEAALVAASRAWGSVVPRAPLQRLAELLSAKP